MSFTDPNVIPAEGVSIVIGGGAAVANVIGFTPPGISVEEVKTTPLSGLAQSFRAGQIPLHSGAKFRIEYSQKDSTHTAILALFTPPIPHTTTFVFTYNEGTTTKSSDAFTGFIKSFTPDGVNENDNYEADIEITINGPVVRTAGA